MSIKILLEKIYNEPEECLLKRLYIDEDKGIKEISEEIDVSVGYVHKKLKKYNICKQKGVWKIE